MRTGDRLRSMYLSALDRLGPSGWWPADSSFEVAVGAILTQNTNWKNVSRALDNLRTAGCLSPGAMAEQPSEALEELIRPSGYFRMKTKKLQALLAFLRDQGVQGDGQDALDLAALRGRDWPELRPLLLDVKGVGPETADSILCYALGHPVFVVDAYTARICSRHGLVPEEVGYDELQALFMDHLAPDAALCNEYHALLVRVGHQWCAKRSPNCGGCPLESFLE